MADEKSLPAANGRMLNTAKRTRFRYPILSNNDTINTESNETCRGRRTLRKKKERKKKEYRHEKSRGQISNGLSIKGDKKTEQIFLFI